MEYNGYTLCFLYLIYSFLGWIGETVVATVKGKGFVNRGFASGPACFIYGFAAVVLAVGFADLRSSPVFLFLGCMVASTVIEWSTAKLLERIHRHRWWDYSGKRWNFDGYVCLQYSLLWGALGTVSVLWTNGLLLRLYSLVPAFVAKPLIWAFGLLALADQLASLAVVLRAERPSPSLERLNRQLEKSAFRLQQRIAAHVERRIQRAYPRTAQPEQAAAVATAQQSMSVGDLLWLFVIGAFLGDVVETLFCRITAGIWMSRSSLVWGPFSVVWGLALVLAAVLLRKDQDKSDRSIFLFGVVMGGVYEYVCSAVGELIFGVVFWDYSAMPFNLGGRINLLYCMFWGVAAVVWMRYLYPLFSRLLEKVRRHVRPGVTAALAVFMAVNMVVSTLALVRYDARADGIPPANGLEQLLDERFGDERMERIYPNAIQR